MSSTSTSLEAHIVNGVNVTALGDTIDAVQKQPEIARFQFRAKNTWLTGGHNRSMIKEFYGACEEDTTRTEPFVLDNAEPPQLLGEDQGANPVEYVLHALAGCMTTTMVYHAAARGIHIKSIESELEGNLDLRGFLCLDDKIRKGFQNVRVKFKIDSDATPEQLEELMRISPVLDIITNPVPVSVEVTSL